MLTPSEIKTFIDNDRASIKKQLARTGQRYYEADHDIKDYRIFFIDADGNLIATSDASVDADGNLVVVMYLDKKLAAGETVDIMDYVSISTAATQNDFAAEGFADGFIIDINADAVQTENMLATYGESEWQNARDSFNAM